MSFFGPKPSKPKVPSTGDGRTSGRKPAKAQLSAKHSDGSADIPLWVALIGLGKRKGK